MHDSIVGISITSQCNVCDAHDAHDRARGSEDAFVAQLRGTGAYDCLIGISGGLDSTWLTRWAVSHQLRALLVHFDNGFNSPEANRNILRVVEASGYPFIRVYADDAYRQHCLALIGSGLPDVDIANDMAMATIARDVARMYRIRWVLNGHQYYTEGWNPIGWTYMDGKYLRSICGPVSRYMDFSLFRQFRGSKEGRPYDHIPKLRRERMKADVAAWCGWESYGEKHAENLYTEWVGAWYLPVRHGIDKRLNYYSAQVRDGTMVKAEARKLLKQTPRFGARKWTTLAHGLGFADTAAFRAFVEAAPATLDREQYPSYRKVFRRFRPLLWVAMRLGLVSRSFYRKYSANG